MKNKKNNTDSNAKKVLAWIPYILIPILIISGVSLYARQQKNEKLEYYQVVQYFDEKKVTEYNLNMSSGALEFKLKGDDKTYTFTVPSVGMFQEDIHNGVIAYNREHPDTPIKAQYQTGSTGAILLNIVPTLLMLVILGAILFYMFRKMNNAMNNENNRTLSFGKARIVSRTVEFVPLTSPYVVEGKKRRGWTRRKTAECVPNLSGATCAPC